MHKKLRRYGLLRLTLKLMTILILNWVDAAAGNQWYLELESDSKIGKIGISTGCTTESYYEPVLFGPDKEPIAFTHHASKYHNEYHGKIQAEPNSIQYVTPGRWIATFKLSNSIYFPWDNQDIVIWMPRGEIPDSMLNENNHLLRDDETVQCRFNIGKANKTKLEAGDWQELTNPDAGLKIKVWGPKCKLPPVQSLNRINMTPPSSCCCSIL